MKTIVIGTRTSRLALWQANWVKDRLQEAGARVRLETIHTSGDRILDRPLAGLGGKGVFVKEIEEALLSRTIDLAVHSLKDLPTEQPEGLLIACVPRREDPRDLFLAPGRVGIMDLAAGAVVGTGSPRRACQIRALRGDLRLKDLRGNVDTRLARLARGDYDAIVLALAGVRRIGAQAEGTVLEFEQMLPAVGQGALAIETRSGEAPAPAALRSLHDPETAAAVAAERAFLRGLGGGCQAPIAAVALVRGATMTLRGLVGEPEGGRLLRERLEGPAAAPEDLGRRLADRLLAAGAADLVGLAPRAPLPEAP